MAVFYRYHTIARGADLAFFGSSL